MPRITPIHRIRKDKRALSPAISTVILTSSVVVLIIVATLFGNNFLNARIAENEFSAVKQFMQTVGLQIDDVSWTIGRTQTTRYASKFGMVNFESCALNYSMYVDKGSGYVLLANYSVGVLLFNMPIIYYSVSNNYQEAIFPTSRVFLQSGTSAPVSHVFVIEKIPMNGNYIRVVVAPSIRLLNSSIITGGEKKNYFRFYLSILYPGPNPRYSQSVTLSGNAVSSKMEENVGKVKFEMTFPKASLGFDNSFFGFKHVQEEVILPSGSVAEIYTGKVMVSLGMHA
jgi:hypothetical protein